ncbi:hypothetical protein MMC12_001725 [Toensbergia leucococca]|nr:hypothetical protein [Toensbergia leucococca]
MTPGPSSWGSVKGEESSLHTLHHSIATIYVGPEKYPFYFHKGRICQPSAFFEKGFHGSFEEATTGSMYLEEDGVDEFVVFEDFLLVKVFCFAEKVGIPKLQNLALDAIRDRCTKEGIPPALLDDTQSEPVIVETSYNSFGWGVPSQPSPLFAVHTDLESRPVQRTPNPVYRELKITYLPPGTSAAICYAYDNTPTGSPLRKLLADIFAYNVKPEALDEDILLFPAEFMADVLLINMKRLPLRLKLESADFDLNAEKYHVQELTGTHTERKQRVSKDVNRKTKSLSETYDYLYARASESKSTEEVTMEEVS